MENSFGLIKVANVELNTRIVAMTECNNMLFVATENTIYQLVGEELRKVESNEHSTTTK